MQHANKTWPDAMKVASALAFGFLAVVQAAAQTPPSQVIEGESLVGSILAADGPVSVQNMGSFGSGWSGNAQLFWRAPNPVDRPVRYWPHLQFAIDVPVAGTYSLAIRYTQAPDYGDVHMSINGSAVTDLVGFSPGVRSARVVVKSVPLKAGRNLVELTVFRRLSASKGAFVGLDAIEINPQSVRATQMRANTDVKQSQQAVGVANVPIGPSATLTFAALGPQLSWNAKGGNEQDIFISNPSQIANLFWESAFKDKFQWRWQVATQPFTSADMLSPAGLVADGAVSSSAFAIDLKSFPPLGTKAASIKSSQPTVVASAGSSASKKQSSRELRSAQPRGAFDLYIRLVPLTQGKPGAPPSNTIIAHVKPGKSAIQQGADDSFVKKAAIETMVKQVNGYALDLVSFTPQVFEREDRWGCVVVVTNPHYLKVGHPLAGYKPGSKEEYCPPKDPDKQEMAWTGWVALAFEGWLFAYDGAAKLWNGVKGWIAEQFAEAVPCELLGDSLESSCEAFAQDVSAAALTYGIAAAGIPPTIPDISALEALSEGEISAAAAEFSCDQIASTGADCDATMEDALRKLYAEGLDEIQSQLKKQGQEPHCGDAATAQLLGRLPLPCFTDYPGTKVKPAKQSVYEPPKVLVRVKRTQPAPDFHPQCRLRMTIEAKNHYPGGQIPGVASPPIPEQDLQGEIYEPETMPLPVLELGESVELNLVFSKFRLFNFVGSPPGTLQEWAELVRGGTTTVRVQTDSFLPAIVQWGYGMGKAPCSNSDSVVQKF